MMMVPSMASLPFKGRVGVGMVQLLHPLMLPQSRIRRFDTRAKSTPSPPNPPLEREGFTAPRESELERCNP